MNNITRLDRVQTKGDSLNCRSPYVFVIPRPFEDDYERNDGWFTQILKLEKKSLQLKATFKKVAELNAFRARMTTELAKRTIELNNRFFKKTDETDFGVDV